jgi:Zn-finger nucleic acid-binding protein
MSYQVMIMCYECDYLHSFSDHEVTEFMTCEKCGGVIE